MLVLAVCYGARAADIRQLRSSLTLFKLSLCTTKAASFRVRVGKAGFKSFEPGVPTWGPVIL